MDSHHKPIRKVLIFTYYWPPAGGPGVQRFLKFSKYLGSFGWEPIIVTPENGSYPYYDESLEKDIPPDLKIHKTKTFDWFRLYNILQGKKGKSVPVAMIGIKDNKSIFQKLSKYIRANYFIPDGRIGWNSYAVKEGIKIIKEEKIDAIITTGPPHSTHLIGHRIKQQFDIPWIADFRDPWTTIYYNKFLPRTKHSTTRDKAWETAVLGSADCITVISRGLQREFADRASHTEVIYNGYDEEDIDIHTNVSQDKFIMSYIGNFKPNQNISEFWLALKELKNDSKGFNDHFRLHLTGKVDPNIKEEINGHGLRDLVVYNDFVPHHKAVALMQEAVLLLFIIPKAENNELILTGKIFEYLAVKTPLLSIGPIEGDASKILKEADRDPMVDYSDKESIKRNIGNYYDRWLANNKVGFHIENEAHKQFSRKALSKQLCDILNSFA